MESNITFAEEQSFIRAVQLVRVFITELKVEIADIMLSF